MGAQTEKKQWSVHFPMTIKYLKTIDVNPLQDGLSFKGLKIDTVSRSNSDHSSG